MNVFISWSGDRSKKIALHLKEWLPAVLHFVEPWVSSEDIHKGTRWGTELAKALESTHTGILCLVSENLSEPWLNFEAGALSKSIAVGRIHPFLVGVEPSALPGPLAQFQATRFSKEDMRKLIRSLNAEAEKATLPTDKVDQSFDICWPDLEKRLNPLLIDEPGNQASRKQEVLTEEQDLTEIEDIVLDQIAHSSTGLGMDDVAALFDVHAQRAQHILDCLEAKRLIKSSNNDLDETSWELSKAGRAFLVKKGAF